MRIDASTSLLTEASSTFCDLDDSVVFLLGWKMLLMIPHSDREASRRIWCEVWPRAICSDLFWECPGSNCAFTSQASSFDTSHSTGGAFLCLTHFAFYVIPLGEK